MEKNTLCSSFLSILEDKTRTEEWGQVLTNFQNCIVGPEFIAMEIFIKTMVRGCRQQLSKDEAQLVLLAIKAVGSSIRNDIGLIGANARNAMWKPFGNDAPLQMLLNMVDYDTWLDHYQAGAQCVDVRFALEAISTIAVLDSVGDIDGIGALKKKKQEILTRGSASQHRAWDNDVAAEIARRITESGN
ncbi:MAG: hypothetical protein M5R36_19710 [Deltaproteobacteria bacterium]|nr:hypothetical protein [Deltaproteobacteria bacterium]